MRFRKRLTPIYLCLVFVALVLGSVFIYNKLGAPVNPDSEENIEFSISSGQGVSSVATNLLEAGLIRSRALFKVQVMLSGVSKKIQAGDFTLSPSMDLVELVSSLTRARTDRRVTLLEGWRREEMAVEIEAKLSVNNPDYSFEPKLFVEKTINLEGQLFPETYFLPKNATTDQVIQILRDTFDQKISGLSNRSGLSDQQALVLASIVEREVRNHTERSMVAGILLKRLNNDWPLQADATVQYLKATRTCKTLECDWWPKQITKADLAIPSEYNTYAQTGLPPAPIANPSLSSIEGAYQPVASVYWFYIHDSAGKIHYATTIEEHNQNIARYL